MPRLPIAVALLLLAPLATAQVYKWTDASGTVHYSEAPPPQGTKYDRVTTTGTVEPLSAPADADAGNAEKPVPAETTESTEPMADTPENRSKLCDSLQANLDMLGGDGPVVMEQDGKNVALDDTQRRQQTASAQAQFDQYCK